MKNSVFSPAVNNFTTQLSEAMTSWGLIHDIKCLAHHMNFNELSSNNIKADAICTWVNASQPQRKQNKTKSLTVIKNSW